MNALAIRPMGQAVAPLGLRADLVALHQVLAELEQGHGADPALDAAIYAALGWQVTTDRWGTRRRLAWRCRSPLSSGWEMVPEVTDCQDHAALLVPYGWDYSAGRIDGHGRAWCREKRPLPGREMPRFFEVNRLTPARALASAALFAVRAVAMEGC
ncbi:hypothetical protein [Falsiroseomonas sp.]|uniref:hypothetical protein n=1 Tax=Falsiroseomonas sp. TaxID=2870721 RepID=UPI002717CBE6|nr:hypothetical protein [Falsiroseomonas sp.]MDO9499011.1 hypothetical protein [Falsiroseomonas sp.]